MVDIVIQGLDEKANKRIGSFIDELLAEKGGFIHSIHIVGSSLTPDFDKKRSDINSVVVLKAMDFSFVRFLASIGIKHKKGGIAAPIVMTPDYINSSLDVFAVEFLDFSLIHKTVHGPDIFKGLTVGREHLRLQCERELKTALIRLRQGYISALGDRKRIESILSGSITGIIPVFRAMVHLFNAAPSVVRRDVIAQFERLSGINTRAFEKVLQLKGGLLKPSKDETEALFEEYYAAIEKTGNVIDKLAP